MKRAAQLSFNHQLTFSSARPKRLWRWFLGAVVVLFVAGVMIYELAPRMPPLIPGTPSLPAIAQTAARPQEPVPAPPPAPVEVKEIAYVVRPKDTLGEIFSRLRLDVNQIPAMLELPVARDKFNALQPGDRLIFSLANGALRAIDRRINDTEVLRITRRDDGLRAEVIAIPIETKMAHVRGTLTSPRFEPGRVVGLSPAMVRQFADIFGWDIDFAHGVDAGDRFNVIYEQQLRGGEYVGEGNIVAAEFIHRDEIHRAVRYVSRDGKIDGYFTPDGHSVRRQFLCAPIDVSRVGATLQRDGGAPLLSLLSEHNGVDYPAPVGTVVKAAGDGRIKSLAADDQYGNTVIIDHDARTSTVYAHLSTFERGLQSGQSVKQGDPIGYVGSSGVATAPHLHYEFRVDGSHVDPRSVEPAAGASIPADHIADFQERSAELLAALKQPSDAVVTAALSR